MKLFLPCLLFCLFATNANSQPGYPLADDLFAWEDYVGALEAYLKIEKKGQADDHVKRRIGQCYLKVHGDKSRAIPYLVQFYNHDKEDPKLLLELGQAYHYSYQFQKAIHFYTLYKETLKKKEEIEKTERMIECVETAQQMVKHPAPVIFEDLGKEVNTKYAEYYPFVTKDEGTLFFTSRRNECVGNEKSVYGYFTSDIFVSRVKNGQWQKAKGMGPMFNTAFDEECVGISSDGKNMVVFVNRPELGYDLLHAEYPAKGKNFARPVTFPEPVNSEFGEFEGCFSSDGNSFYFVSDREGGLGDADIYVSRKLPTGEWGIPENLGAAVNTKFTEGFPVISEDGKTLFFASQGHTNMGGFDIFKSKWDSVRNRWSDAVNIGYPINTTSDDMMYSVAGNGRDGYISQWRKEGIGDLDIYKVVFTDVEPLLTALHGKISSLDSTKTKLEASITLSNAKTKQEIEVKDINPGSGKYVFIVEPGQYTIKVSCSGHKDFVQTMNVYDKVDYKVDIESNPRLEPLNWSPPAAKKTSAKK